MKSPVLVAMTFWIIDGLMWPVPPHSWSPSASMMPLTTCSAISLIVSWRLMQPSSNLGAAAWRRSPLLCFPCGLALSSEPDLSRSQILGRGRAFFIGGLAGRFAPYTNFLDTIFKSIRSKSNPG